MLDPHFRRLDTARLNTEFKRYRCEKPSGTLYSEFNGCQDYILKGPFTHAIFVAIPNRPCKLAAISWRFVATKSPRFRTCWNLSRFTGDFFSLRVTNRHKIAASLHGRFAAAKIAAKIACVNGP